MVLFGFSSGEEQEKQGLSGSHAECFLVYLSCFDRCAAALCCGVLGWTATLAWSQALLTLQASGITTCVWWAVWPSSTSMCAAKSPSGRANWRAPGAVGVAPQKSFPFDRAGVPGTEMLRLLQLGVVAVWYGADELFSAQHPEYTAPIWRG